KFPVKYAAQVGVTPPTFVFFTRAAQKLHFSIQRFVVNRLREKYGFYDTPIRLLYRGSKKRGLKSRQTTDHRPQTTYNRQ
ncbi:MAG: hypothetical protein O6826_08255, partial [Acidobacteria bacterium]|nr:hypothetical protein [Acidobacteriota bacterium]